MRTVAELLEAMTREEKVAQLVSLWVTVDTDRGGVAPYQGNFMPDPAVAGSIEDRLRDGMGQLTRPFGSAPVTATDGARLVDDLQRRLREGTRLGIPAIVHEECLTGFMTLGATEFPNPLDMGPGVDRAGRRCHPPVHAGRRRTSRAGARARRRA
jgi:beta-xylosidase